MVKSRTLYVALGSNLGDRHALLHEALRLLGERIGTLEKCASIIETAPEGFESSHAFLNTVAAFDTTLTPEELLQETQGIERILGRTTKSENGVYANRTIDIDLIHLTGVYGTFANGTLELPHPHFHARRFVLEPLCEIAPYLYIDFWGNYAFEHLNMLNGIYISTLRDELEGIDERANAEAVLPRINELLTQLSPTTVPCTADNLLQLSKETATHMYFLKDKPFGSFIGSFTLAFTPLFTGKKAWLEDVVIDVSQRGKGWGKKMLKSAIDYARVMGVTDLRLTSKPERKAANNLYRQLGFEQRHTNNYRLLL